MRIEGIGEGKRIIAPPGTCGRGCALATRPPGRRRGRFGRPRPRRRPQGACRLVLCAANPGQSRAGMPVGLGERPTAGDAACPPRRRSRWPRQQIHPRGVTCSPGSHTYGAREMCWYWNHRWPLPRSCSTIPVWPLWSRPWPARRRHRTWSLECVTFRPRRSPYC